jgi:hypothetical protein
MPPAPALGANPGNPPVFPVEMAGIDILLNTFGPNRFNT